MLAFLDNGFFLFLVIALLSAVSDWISKRRAAKKEDDSLSAPPITTGRETGAPEPALGDSPQRKLPKLFEHLEQELKRLAKDSPVVEVLEERPEDQDLKFVGRSLIAILEDCNVEKKSPPLGSDVRDLSRIVDDNVKFESTTDPNQAHLISEVLLEAYVFDPEGVNQTIKPAKVRVYRYEGNEELD